MFMVVFISLAILFFIAAQILGTESISDCTNLKGYNATAPQNKIGEGGNTYKYDKGTWAANCFKNTENVVAGFNLMGIVFLVLAVVMVLRVIGWLG